MAYILILRHISAGGNRKQVLSTQHAHTHTHILITTCVISYFKLLPFLTYFVTWYHLIKGTNILCHSQHIYLSVTLRLSSSSWLNGR